MILNKNGLKMATLELLGTLHCVIDYRFILYNNKYCNIPDKRNLTYFFCNDYKGYYIFNPILWFIYIYILIINQWTFTLHELSWVLIQHKSLEAWFATRNTKSDTLFSWFREKQKFNFRALWNAEIEITYSLKPYWRIISTT